MFIADTSKIVRASMDGGDVRELVTDVIYKASGVAVDIVAQRVFWCDALLDYVETIRYDGTGRTVVIRGGWWGGTL